MKIRLKNFFQAISKSLSKIFLNDYFMFSSGHDYISDIKEIELEFKCPKNETVFAFEEKFAKVVGSGVAVSFASARMSFYTLLEYYMIGEGDEVILNGATCSVMANAVLRVGAKPIYSDIDPDSYGSSLAGIIACITENTKLIVAQHSFGIPCRIQEICSYARGINIPVIEDCALAVDSQYRGITVGNFGEASIFSFDGTKPINCFLGGVVYSNNNNIIQFVIEKQRACSTLPDKKIKAIYDRFLFNRKYLKLKYSKFSDLYNLYQYVKIKFFNKVSPFLDDDFHSYSCSQYPYPARMPSFLALIGIYELERWGKEREGRRLMLKMTVDLFGRKGLLELMALAYFDPDLNITPLRIVINLRNTQVHLRKHLKNFMDTDSFWFMQPIVATIEPLEAYGYKIGSCPISEDLGKSIINMPTNYPVQQFAYFLKLLSRSLYAL